MYTKGTDQPAHVPSIISAFIIRSLEIIIAKVAMSKVSMFN